MTIHKLLKREDSVSDIGTFIRILGKEFANGGQRTFLAFKFIFYDTTVAIARLPFGNWLSIAYLTFMISLLKSMVDRGELYRVLNRAFCLVLVDREPVWEIAGRIHPYLWRCLLFRVDELKTGVYSISIVAWNNTGERVKQGVASFTREVIVENADEIERRAKELAQTTIITAVSQKLISDLGPSAFEAFMKTDLARSILETRQITDQLKYDVGIVSSHLSDNHADLIAKINGVVMELEYIKATQPDNFRTIMTAVSASVPVKLLDVLAPYYSGRKRIGNV
jgi:hypothetical protein